MTDQHPLTDDIIRYDKKLGCQDLSTWIYTENDLRAAADWQLEQVLNWCSKYIHTKSVDALREAMRPTTTPTETP